ncbi:MAG TPA: putative toxin-antitoxin system toxin component, PIN family [Bryobacteraceae bacterium]|jgi:putative PIN family toxin of toxin-antitoxin system
MRVTPDTGILIRMNVKATGPAKRLLDTILDGPHELVLSEFLLKETARVLRYPRLQRIYQLNDQEISEHVELLRARSDLVDPVVLAPVVLGDPEDDPVVYTAAMGRVEVLCAMDRHFYSPPVVDFCRQRGIDVMNDVELLQRLRAAR